MKKSTELLNTHCGTITVVGRPNVGKSTLINHLLGQKICITSRKPQTTRHAMMGVLTRDQCQMIFVDTPGLHQNAPKAINRYMNRAAARSLHDVDLIIFVVEANRWTEEDQWVFEKIAGQKIPSLLIVNKVDKMKDKAQLLPYLKRMEERQCFAEIVPISALKKQNLDRLLERIETYLPKSEFLFDEDQLTDRSQKFLVAEIIREKILRQTGQEVPHELTVTIDSYQLKDGIYHISAILWVERDTQKAIVIGHQGQRLKTVGQQSRLDIEKLIDNKVMLTLWVKVKKGWSDSDKALQGLGYVE